MILEDTDHDGKADISKVFVEDKDLIIAGWHCGYR